MRSHLVHCTQAEPPFVLNLCKIQNWDHCRGLVICGVIGQKFSCLHMCKMRSKQIKLWPEALPHCDSLFACRMSSNNSVHHYPLIVFICEVKRGFPVIVWLMLVLQAPRNMTLATFRHITIFEGGMNCITHHIEDVMAIGGE